MDNEHNSSNYNTWIQPKPTAHIPDSEYPTHFRLLYNKAMANETHTTFVTLTTCKNIFSDVYFTVQWSSSFHIHNNANEQTP
jgi:hypothetical protein